MLLSVLSTFLLPKALLCPPNHCVLECRTELPSRINERPMSQWTTVLQLKVRQTPLTKNF